jgi:MerR family mercuric resistance operon transcriptional regulator
MSLPKRPAQGPRLYGVDDLARLRFIKGAQKMTFSLDEIKSLLQMSDGQIDKPAVRAMTEARLTHIRTLKASLEAIDQALTASMAQCAMTDDAAPCPIMQHFIASYVADHNESGLSTHLSQRTGGCHTPKKEA